MSDIERDMMAHNAVERVSATLGDVSTAEILGKERTFKVATARQLVFGAFVLYVGSKDIEEKKMERQLEYNVDSLRQAHKQLITLEDSLHEFEDGY